MQGHEVVMLYLELNKATLIFLSRFIHVSFAVRANPKQMILAMHECRGILRARFGISAGILPTLIFRIIKIDSTQMNVFICQLVHPS